MRVAIAELKQETNTFVLQQTTLTDFKNWHLFTGDEVISGLANTNCEIAGFLDVLEPAGIEPVPILATFAISGGPVASETFETLLADLLAGLEAARPYDGVLLALHGAMVTDTDDDPDGAILTAVRAAIGPDMPLVVSMDVHANVTRRCVEQADAIAGFRTSPHIDQRDTGQRAARVMVRMLKEGVRPTGAFIKIPMVVPASTHIHHLPGPYQRLMQTAAAAESDQVLAADVFTVQPWLDIEDLGFAAVVYTDNDPELAEAVAADLAALAWSEREAFMELHLVPIEEAIARAVAAPEGPIVLSDMADGTGAGSPGDATAVIAALLAADLDVPALVCVRDPEAAAEAIAAGVGATVELTVGAKLDTVYNRPVTIRGEVTFAGPASFRFGGGGYTGVEMEMGTCAVIQAGQVSILITSNSVFTVDPEMYRAVGLEPKDAKIVVVKSHIQFRAGYDDIAKEIILLDSPGMSSDHLEALPFKRIPRPMYPFDRDLTFDPA